MNYFFAPDHQDGVLHFDAEESKHISRVLRKNVGDLVGVQDGKGSRFMAEITELGKNKVSAKIKADSIACCPREKEDFGLTLAIAPTKNMDRIEMVLEKGTELGVKRFIFIESSNSERRKINLERVNKKIMSAFKQSAQFWLPEFLGILPYSEVLLKAKEQDQYYICSCTEGLSTTPLSALKGGQKTLVLIGPEGDFSPKEVQEANDLGFINLSLGNNRLRTETAGLLICAHIYTNTPC